MNKNDARQIANTITNKQLADMFLRAKNEITDWKERSSANKSLTKGVAWNCLAKDFDINYKYHVLGKKNMVWEFGDFLPDDLKIKHVKRKLPEPIHQEPVFN